MTERLTQDELDGGKTLAILIRGTDRSVTSKAADMLEKAITEVEHLQAELKNWKLATEAEQRETARQRQELELRRSKARDEYWCWQGDADDHLESLTCPVLISADKMRALQAEVAAKDAKLSDFTELIDSVRKCCDGKWPPGTSIADIRDALKRFDRSPALSDAAEHPTEVQRPAAEGVWICQCGYMNVGGICTKCGTIRQPNEAERLRGVLRTIRQLLSDPPMVSHVKALIDNENV